ncbi:MAG: helix-turn-helix domain-containing protein [Planctomycetota bacterium]|jgi:excisionase family DNA binding protein
MRQKEVYTSGDIARILKVTTNTVTKWFDQGVIKGYTLPGSKARRITASDFEAFIKRHEVPVGRLQKEASFTTAECAHFCFVTTNTVTKWADKGLLPCFNLGGSNRRLIFQKELVNFMKENSIPQDRLKNYASAKKKPKAKRGGNGRRKTARKKRAKKAKAKGRRKR